MHARAGFAFVTAIVTMGLTGAAVAITRWLVLAHAYQVGNFFYGSLHCLFGGHRTRSRPTQGEGSGVASALLGIGALVAGSFAAAGIGLQRALCDSSMVWEHFSS